MLRQQHEYHPIIGYRYIPNLKIRILHESGGYLNKVNNLGFRCNHEFVVQKRPGMRRILLFGDSMTDGSGVSNENRYGDFLESKIPNLEVYNFALGGTCTGQQYLTYREFASGIEHDLMIIAPFVQTIQRTAAHYKYYLQSDGSVRALYAKPYFELVNGKLVLKGVPVPTEPVDNSGLTKRERDFIDSDPLSSKGKLSKLIVKTNMERLAIKATFSWDPYPEYKSKNNPKWMLLRAILEEWIANHKQPVILMPIPSRAHYDGEKSASHYQARFRELLEVLPNCTLHDPLLDLLRYSLKERREFHFKMDWHLSPKGHLAIANSIEPRIRKLLEPNA